MKSLRTFSKRALLLTLLAGTISTFAAEKPAAAGKEVVAPDPGPAWQRRIAELSYDALPLGEVVNQLRQSFPEINFLIRNPASTNSNDVDANGVAIRIKRMRALTLEECLRAIELAADFPLQITGRPNDRLVVFERKLADTPPAAVQTRVFSLARYLASRSESENQKALVELQDAVELTSAMLRERSGGQTRTSPQLRVHQGTKLLIAVGSPEELQVVEQVVGALQDGAKSDSVSPSTNASNKLQSR